jgi:prepilin-type N-terminal cleavage/methylation domain-containing protein
VSTETSEGGFTLIEMVIAMMVISIAIVALVSGLASMLQLSGEHRGNAAIETTARSYAQAVEAAAQAQTTLTSAVSSTATTLPVKDASLFTAGAYVSVDRESMTVTAVNTSPGANTLSVTRNINGDATVYAHASGTSVNRLLQCPNKADLTPPSGSWTPTPGVQTPSVASVEYWNGSAFTGTCTLVNPNYPGCDGSQILAECAVGLYRATVTVAASDSRFRNVTTTTTVLVRAGGS